MKAHVRNKHTNNLKEVNTGFSWLAFFFGFFVPLFKGDWKWFIVLLVVSIAVGTTIPYLGFVLWIVQGMFYNKMYLTDLMNSGNYEPATSKDAEIIMGAIS